MGLGGRTKSGDRGSFEPLVVSMGSYMLSIFSRVRAVEPTTWPVACVAMNVNERMCKPCGAASTLAVAPSLNKMLDGNLLVSKGAEAKRALVSDNILTDAKHWFVNSQKLLMGP